MMLPATTYAVFGKENHRVKIARAVLEEQRETSGACRTGEEVLSSTVWVRTGYDRRNGRGCIRTVSIMDERDTQIDQTDQSNQVAVRPQLSAAGMSVVSLRHAILT